MKKWLSILLGVVTAIGGFLDAGTIATAGEAGAKFGLGLIWAIVIATVAIILLVEMSGRFAAVSQKAYAEAVREQFGFKFYAILLLSEIIAESLLLTAELGGMAIALALLTGISWHWLFPLAALIVAGLAWRAPFSLIENGPALLGLVVLAFPAAVIVLGGPSTNNWQTLWQPQIKAGEWSSYLYLAAAILGATISPYLLYFYSSGAIEEKWTKENLGVNKVTAVVGMGFGSISSIALVALSAIVLQPLTIQAGTLGEIGLALAKPFGQIGGWLFAAALFITAWERPWKWY